MDYVGIGINKYVGDVFEIIVILILEMEVLEGFRKI